MKKLLILVICFGLVLVGCCTLTTDGVTTKSFSNCLTAAKNIVCNPTDTVKAEVKVGAAIIEGIIASLVPGSAAFITAVAAYDTSTYILAGSCVTVTQLNNLIAFFKSDVFKSAQVSMKGAKAGVKGIDVQVLVNWGKTAK